MTLPKVAFLSFSRLATGGIETHLLQLMRGLRGEFEFTAAGTIEEPFHSAAESLGARILPLPAAGKASLPMVFRLRGIFRDRGFSLIHTHETRAGLLGRPAARLAGIPALHTVHTPSFFLPTSPSAIWFYRMAERILNTWFSAGVIFVSPAIRNIYLQGRLVPESKSFLVRNGLEEEWFSIPPREPEPRREVVFLYIGRLAREKGLTYLAQAFSKVAARFPQARLTVVGEGPERGRLTQLASEAGWEDRLTLRGNLDRGEVRRELLSADAFVLPSRFESMSYTLMEAMACSLPCIATYVGGNHDLVDTDKTGFLVPYGNPDALADVMERLIPSPEIRLRMGQAGCEKIREFSVWEMVRQTREVYRKLIDEGR